jgi:tetratricopeptide (TPR) repeat protein
LLAEEGWKIYSTGKLAEHPYFSQALLLHLSELSHSERLAAVLLDPELIDRVWSKEARNEWQRHISGLRHMMSLTDLVENWLRIHEPAGSGGERDAVVTGKLSRLFQAVGAFDEAVSLAEAALRIWQANNISDSPGIVESLLVLGRIQSAREELDRATESYEKAAAIARRAYGQESQQMAEVVYELAIFYHQAKRDYKKSWECLEKCLAIWSRSNPPNFVGMANCINDRAVILEAEGKAADYLGIYQEALLLFEQAQPDGHPEMVAILCNISNELRKQGQVEEPLKMLRRAVQVADDILLPQHEYSGAARIALTNDVSETPQLSEKRGLAARDKMIQ